MNITEAREIIKHYERYAGSNADNDKRSKWYKRAYDLVGKNRDIGNASWEAKGFIEGYESNLKKIEVLMQVAEMIAGCHQHDVQSCPCQITAIKALKTVEGKE